MKRLIYILSTLFLLSSCVKDLREPLITIDGKEVQEGYALVDFSVNVPYGCPGTKAFADTPEIDNLYIAVFDQNRYLEDFVEAISKGPVSKSQDGTYPDVNYNDASAESTTWNFQATLPISTEPRYLHFIANSPVDKLSFGREDEVIGDLATEAGQDAYWQMIELPNGITVDNQGILSTSVQARMQNVALIRNFSKISVTASPVTSDQNSSNFELDFIYVMNRPTSGTVAPYNALRSSFIQNYQSYTSDELKGTSIARPSTQTVGRPIVGVVYEGSTTQSDNMERCIVESTEQYVYLSRSKATGNAIAGKTYYSKIAGTPIYEGWMPMDFDIDRKNPGEAGPENPNWISPTKNANGEKYANEFLYERTKPASATDNPVCVLVYGTYYGDKTKYSDGIKCYYKIDIKDGDDKYFAILRNFDYKINIKKVNAIGRLKVEDAMVMPGSGNVSTDITNEDKTNISDGVSRMAVSFTDTTVVTGSPFTLKYKFIPNFQQHPNVSDNAVVSVGSNENGKRVTVTTEGEMFSYTVGTVTDSEGYNTITIDPIDPQSEPLTQKLTITGVAVDGSTISREITVVLREKMTLGLYCDPASIDKKTGTEFDVVLKIPNELNRMLFPLEIKIESSNLTITPAQGDNLPVSSGKSIDPNNESGKTSFYFIKTVSFQDYSNAYLSEDGNREIRCHFKSNTDISATTIWAANQYFNTGSTTLGNYDAYEFTNLRYEAGSNFTPGQNVNFAFEFKTDEGYNSLHNAGKPVTVTLVNLRPQDGDESLEGGTPSTKIDGGYEYTFTPTGRTNNTFQLTAAAAKGPYIVYLDADHFRQAEKRRTRTITIAANALTFKNASNNNDLFGNTYQDDVKGYVIVRTDEYDTDLSGNPRTDVSETYNGGGWFQRYNCKFNNTDAMTITVDTDATEVYFLYDLNGTIYSGSRKITPGDSNIILTGDVTFSKRKTQGKLSISDMSLYVGDSQQVTITENTNDSAVTYEISDPTVVSITNGTVTALKPGTVTVTATAVATNTYSKAQTTFKVTVSRLAVDITVNDTVSGNVKSELTIKNTGGSRIYIRAMIDANWYDSAGNIVAPLSAAPGTFVGLPGNGWEEEGGIYYYTSPLDPNASPTALFSKYTKAATPPVPGATLKMTIYVQALEYVEGRTCQQVFQD